MNKKNWILLGAFLLVFLAGMFAIRLWDSYRLASASQAMADMPGSNSLLMIDMEKADEPEGVIVVE